MLTARLSAVLSALLAALALVVLPSTSAGADTEYPKLGISPAGANDWSCVPTADRPHPAVLVHGTFGDQQSLLDRLSLRLKRDGYCVFSLDYGNRGTGPIENSASELKAFVDEVLAATGAAKVSLVGHSQGGMMPRYFIKNLGGASIVEDLVGVAPSNHGTEVSGSFSAGDNCTACDQQSAGSPFLTELNSGDETPGEVDYTQITTKNDEVVVPYTSGFLTPGPASTNIVIQDSCALDGSEHLSVIFSQTTIRWTLNALNREGPADPAAPIACV